MWREATRISSEELPYKYTFLRIVWNKCGVVAINPTVKKIPVPYVTTSFVFVYGLFNENISSSNVI